MTSDCKKASVYTCAHDGKTSLWDVFLEARAHMQWVLLRKERQQYRRVGEGSSVWVFQVTFEQGRPCRR